MKPVNLGIRADGNSQIGMGHIIRCLSLAEEFQKNGDRVLFISNDPVGIEKITAAGFRSVPAGGDEIEAIARIVAAENLQILILDSYEANREYLLALKQKIDLLCYIDDLNQFANPAEIIINGNYAAERMGYCQQFPSQIQLLGVEYNLIREEFKALPRATVKPRIERILITMGGSDVANLSGKLIEILRKDPGLAQVSLDVVIGAGNPRRDELETLSRKYSNLYLHYNVRRMSELMCQADLAISAGGSTLYELCACGTPTLTVIVAANQEYVVGELAKSGYITNLGWDRQLDPEQLKGYISQFSYNKRRKISTRMQRLVDGNGAARVREKTVECYWGIGMRREARVKSFGK